MTSINPFQFLFDITGSCYFKSKSSGWLKGRGLSLPWQVFFYLFVCLFSLVTLFTTGTTRKSQSEHYSQRDRTCL